MTRDYQTITHDVEVIFRFKSINLVDIIKREDIWNWLKILWRKFFEYFDCLFKQVLLDILQASFTLSDFLPELKHSFWLVLEKANTHFTSSVVLGELNLLFKASIFEALLNKTFKSVILEFLSECFAPLNLFIQNVWVKNSLHKNIFISNFELMSNIIRLLNEWLFEVLIKLYQVWLNMLNYILELWLPCSYPRRLLLHRIWKHIA